MVLIENSENVDYFTSLNVDCIFEVFSHLSPNDLCEVGQTCKKLRELADTHFVRHYKGTKISLENRKGVITFAEKYQKYFSHLIQSLDLHFDVKKNEKLLQFIRQNCTKNVKTVSFDGHLNKNTDWIQSFTDAIKDFIPNVETASFSHFSNINLDDILKHSRNIKRLEILDGIRIPVMEYPKLDDFTCCVSTQNIGDFTYFIQKNPNLKRLKCYMVDCSNNDLMKRFLETIIQSNIEELFIVCPYFVRVNFTLNQNEWRMLDERKFFKRLMLHGVNEYMENIHELALMKSFTGFDFRMRPVSSNFDASITSLSLLVNLKVLFFTFALQGTPLHRAAVLKISQGLINLEELYTAEMYARQDVADSIISPFIRYSSKLIRINFFSRTSADGMRTFNISKLCEERKKLKNATPLTIYYDFEKDRKKCPICLETELVSIKQVVITYWSIWPNRSELNAYCCYWPWSDIGTKYVGKYYKTTL